MLLMQYIENKNSMTRKFTVLFPSVPVIKPIYSKVIAQAQFALIVLHFTPRGQR